MRQSQLFTRIERNVPADEVSKNAQLLIRAGFVNKEMAGVYSYLPLGLLVLRNIERVIREEMTSIGAKEVLLTTLQDPEVWKKSGRWVEEEVDATKGLPWFKTKLSNGVELGIANTHEEALTEVLRRHLSSYKDLPVYVYQIHNKFRNELRAKSGLMRGREFLMKDLYSFNRNEEDFKKFYEECASAYLRIFTRVGLGEITYRTFASGGAFSRFSDEFQTISDVGEDTIYLDPEKRIAVNKEVYTDDVLESLGLEKEKLVEKKAIEVGNIFTLGTRYTESIGLVCRDEEGQEFHPFMGSYGIGLSRLIGTIVETHSDETGIIWPKEVAPFDLHLIELSGGQGDKIYRDLQAQGLRVLYDDREQSAGEKFADADLIGLPCRVITSAKTGDQIEVKFRTEKEGSLTPPNALKALLDQHR
ncbi:MAG: proline--tRNA ligase [Anaplasmataceae bacterium]|nr:proline--tRNA ligase [Anaplasmataceae bacterium]